MIKRVLKALLASLLRLRMYLPEALPLTPDAHYRWASSVLELAGMPDNTSFRHALATMLMHLPDNATSAPKRKFIKLLKKSIINQISYNEIMSLKAQDKAANEQSKLQEATAEVV